MEWGSQPVCSQMRYKGRLLDLSWRMQWQLTPVLLLGKIPWTEEPGRLQSMGS